MKYASDLADGLSDLAHADPDWQIKPEKFDPAAHLEQALQNNRVDAVAARADARESAVSGAPQDRSPTTARRRPRAAGRSCPRKLKLEAGPDESARRDRSPRGSPRPATTRAGPASRPDGGRTRTELQEAVKRFQRRHGLTDDGVIAGRRRLPR